MDKDLRTVEKRAALALPALYAPDKKTAERVLEFFAAKLRNKNTRKAYARATGGFAAWCEGRGLQDLSLVRTLHVAAYVNGVEHTTDPSLVFGERQGGVGIIGNRDEGDRVRREDLVEQVGRGIA